MTSNAMHLHPWSTLCSCAAKWTGDVSALLLRWYTCFCPFCGSPNYPAFVKNFFITCSIRIGPVQHLHDVPQYHFDDSMCMLQYTSSTQCCECFGPHGAFLNSTILKKAPRGPKHCQECVLDVHSNIHWSIKTIQRNITLVLKRSGPNQIVD